MKAKVKETGETVRVIDFVKAQDRTILVESQQLFACCMFNDGTFKHIIADDIRAIDDEESTPLLRDKREEEIDWEERRYELAKAALQGLCSDPKFYHYSWDTCAAEAIGYANELINQLKE